MKKKIPIYVIWFIIFMIFYKSIFKSYSYKRKIHGIHINRKIFLEHNWMYYT